ncbi:MAG: hypothetical protein ACRC1Z_17315 [Waterburya sp.]
MNKILAQEDHYLTLESIAKQVSVGEQSEVMRQILAICYFAAFGTSNSQIFLSNDAGLT